MTDAKWLRKGEITFKLDEDEYKAKLTNKELPLFLDMSRKMRGNKGDEISEELSQVLLELCRRGLKNANPDLDSAIIDAFVTENSFRVTLAFMNAVM
jgi:hypothetical protein